MKKWLFLFIALFLTIGLAACGESDIEKAENEDNQQEDTNGENAGEQEDNQKEEDTNENKTEKFAIGDTVNFDGVKITLNEARIEPGGEFDTPQNDQFVVVNLSAENTTDEEVTMSSIMNIELKDAESYSYSTTILTEGIKAQFDGSIEPGGTLRGEIPFDVPKSESYELHFSDPFKSGKAIWEIPSDQLSQ
ncbi:DUF4352 domain-containing protein [Virgibacillus sp. MSP4-1]|uniref:DUF4352 domain-containing protein n=1 Tax=Virgibacillus sp. MSP4-1 TaxID=2700081 RepID=UPI0003A1B273|nr:DUF4352 domain-containing protein [Virgibacillus sp. MSP4-1]QHS24166.1 DUF4352 domain-containing protein [Virgibacillus sp. MSP4-1]